ncbi:MAG: Hpt domain-containing protein, partial [Pirellulales bacterium]
MTDDLSGFSMLELFRLEAESQTEILSAGILSIEQMESSPQTIESLMRAAHSLKGAARIVNLDPAVRVAHALEDVFIAAGEGRIVVTAGDTDLLLTSVAFLSGIAVTEDAGEATWLGRANKLVADLNTLLAGESGNETPAAPVATVPPVAPTPSSAEAGSTPPAATDSAPPSDLAAEKPSPSPVPAKADVQPTHEPANSAARNSAEASPSAIPAAKPTQPPANTGSNTDIDDEERVVR